MGTLSGNIVAPSQTATGVLVNPSAHGDLTAPAATVSSAITSGQVLSGAILADAATVDGVITSSSVLSGALVAPAATVTSRLGLGATAIAPAATVTSTVLSGSVLSGAVRARPATVTGDLSSQGVLSAVIVAPRARASGTLLPGQVLNGAVNAASAKSVGRLFAGNVLSSSTTAPSPEVTGVIALGQLLVAAAVAPSATVRGAILNELVETFVGWLMNTEHGGVTNYTNFPFHTLAEFNGNYYGVSSSGIFLLGGNDDNGTAIDATMEFGVTDLGAESVSRLAQVVFDMRASGMLKLHVALDGEEEEYTYQVQPLRSGLHPVPVDTGRGMQSRNWQFSITNVEGADFDLNAVDFHMKRINRRA